MAEVAGHAIVGSVLAALGAGLALVGIFFIIFSFHPYPANASHGEILTVGLVVLFVALLCLGGGVSELVVSRRAYRARHPIQRERRQHPQRVNRTTTGILWAVVVALMWAILARWRQG